MCCREKTIYPGQTLTLKQPASSYNLPAGLMPGTKAILKAHSYGGMTIDVNGVEWHIFDRCVAYELEYQIGPHWFPASDPRVVQYLADWKAKKRLSSSKSRKQEFHCVNTCGLNFFRPSTSPLGAAP